MRIRSVAPREVARPTRLGLSQGLLRLGFKMAFVGGVVAACSPSAFHEAIVEHFSESTYRLPAWMAVAHTLDDGAIEGDARYRGIGQRCGNFEARFRVESTEGKRADRGAGLRYTLNPKGQFEQIFDFVTRHPMVALDRVDLFDEAIFFERPQNLKRWNAMTVSAGQNDLRALKQNPDATAEKLAISGSLDRAFDQVADGKYPRNFVKNGLNAKGQPCVYDVRLTPDKGTFDDDAALWRPGSDGRDSFLTRWLAQNDPDTSGDDEASDENDSSTPVSGASGLAAYIEGIGLGAPRITPETLKFFEEVLADMDQPQIVSAFALDPRDDVVVCETGMPAPPGSGNDLAWAAGLVGDDGSQRTVVGTWGDLRASLERDFSSAIVLAPRIPNTGPLRMQAQVHDDESATGRLDDAGAVMAGTETDVTIGERSVTFKMPEFTAEPSATFIESFLQATTITDTFCDELSVLDNMSDLDLAKPGNVADEACVRNANTLCLQGDRYKAEVNWKDFDGSTGPGTAIGLEDPTGGLLFFGPEQDQEMLVKVLNGCEINDRFWVFAAANTNVEYDLRVTDTASGATQTYHHPLGQSSAAVTDTSSFRDCP
jgi:hypothetical protein